MVAAALAIQLPIEIVSKIVGRVNELDHATTFQVQIDTLGNNHITLNESSLFVRSVTQSLETIADCCRHKELLNDITEWLDEPVERHPDPFLIPLGLGGDDNDRYWQQISDEYCQGIIGNKTCSLQLEENDIENINDIFYEEIDELATKLAGLSADKERLIIDCAWEAANPELKPYVDKLEPMLVWMVITERANSKRIERI